MAHLFYYNARCLHMSYESPWLLFKLSKKHFSVQRILNAILVFKGCYSNILYMCVGCSYCRKKIKIEKLLCTICNNVLTRANKQNTLVCIYIFIWSIQMKWTGNYAPQILKKHAQYILLKALVPTSFLPYISKR